MKFDVGILGDRFLEAVWREALWLVKDGIATTEEIDEAIRRVESQIRVG